MLRLELLKVKADLERELGQLVLELFVLRPDGALACQSWSLAMPLGTESPRRTG
jgi:hypothetical protein